MSDANERLASGLAERYRIERELGSGGMATVYLAQDLKHERGVAIKVLHEELALSLGADRFLAEIKTTAKLQHPHILPLLDSGTTAGPGDQHGLLYYVMPYVAGESLRGRLARETQLPLDEALLIAREVADALTYAHSQHIVHRDIKPENILLHSGHALVADFGVALAVTTAGGARLTASGLAVGTPAYMSPEQAAGNRVIDQRADVYALGSIVYEMLAGQPPFVAPTAQGVVARVLSEDPADLRSLRPSVPAAIAEAVARALQKLPADRWASAAEFAGALGVSASPPERGTRRSPARAWRVTAAVGLATFFIGYAGARLTSDGTATSLGARADSRFWTLALPDSAPFSTRAASGAPGSALAVSPDGSTIAYSAAVGGKTHLHLLFTDRTGASAVRVDGTEDARLPAFSPDGEWISFVATGELRKVNVGSRAVVRLAPLESPTGLFWMSNDELLVSQQGIGPARVPAAGGQLRPLGEHFTSISVVHTQLLPGGEYMLGATAYGELATISMRTGALRFITADNIGLTARAEFGRALRGRNPRYLASGHLVYASGASLMAARFDPRELRVTSRPTPLLHDLRADGATSEPQFALGDEILVYATGRDGSIGRLAWHDARSPADSLAVSAGSILAFRVSPNGRRLALVERLPAAPAALRIIDLARGSEERVRLAGEFIPETWDAGAARLFGSIVPDTSRERACCFAGAILDVTSQRVSLTPPAGPDVSQREFSQGANGLRCQSIARGVHFAVVLRDTADATRRRELGGFPFDCSISPDGRWLVYSERDGLFATRVVLDDAPRFKLAPEAREVRWAPDGRSLVYRAGNRLLRMTVRGTGTALEAGPPNVLASVSGTSWDVLGTGWDMGADGRILVLRLPTQPDADHLRVVTHLTALIAARLASERSPP